MMKSIAFDRARQAIQIEEVLRLVGFVPRTRRGDQWRGPCPLERDPLAAHDRSFSVNVRRGIWRCFHCRRGGNVLDLWAAYTEEPIYASTIDLFARLGIAVPWADHGFAGTRTGKGSR